MATISITIPDEVAPEVVAAFVSEYRWRSVEEDGPQLAWPKKCLVRLIKTTVRTHRIKNATAVVETQPDVDAT